MGNGIEHQGNELKNWKPDLYNEKRSFSIGLKLPIKWKNVHEEITTVSRADNQLCKYLFPKVIKI